ncbi:MAG: RNA methyltransferase [Firmicutes bacterium]|nr:RNA methyltransferase [Bacillota bacterium]MBQ1580466.1 RNA methyltransferase [Bacillota bacterium]
MQHAGRNNCIEIHSKDNKTVKLAASLAEKKHRDALGAYLIEGPNLVREALQQGVRIQFIFTGAGALNQQQEIQDILSLAEDSDSAVCVLSEDCFAKIATSQTPQPIMAVAEKRTWQMRDVFSPGGNVLVLDRIQDPGNLGTLLRTAEATGFAGALIVKGGADPYGPKAVRAGAGCVFRFPLLLCESPAEALDILAKQRKQVWTADMEGTPCYDAELAQNVAIVIGNEGNGADALFKENSGRVTVPMAGQTESLNAGIAAAILMYESLRQRAARSVRENTATL